MSLRGREFSVKYSYMATTLWTIVDLNELYYYGLGSKGAKEEERKGGERGWNKDLFSTLACI